jgi:hypothetical protein
MVMGLSVTQDMGKPATTEVPPDAVTARRIDFIIDFVGWKFTTKMIVNILDSLYKYVAIIGTPGYLKSVAPTLRPIYIQHRSF